MHEEESKGSSASPNVMSLDKDSLYGDNEVFGSTAHPNPELYKPEAMSEVGASKAFKESQSGAKQRFEIKTIAS